MCMMYVSEFQENIYSLKKSSYSVKKKMMLILCIFPKQKLESPFLRASLCAGV